jgi:hypothetical protein
MRACHVCKERMIRHNVEVVCDPCWAVAKIKFGADNARGKVINDDTGRLVHQHADEIMEDFDYYYHLSALAEEV